MKASHHNILFLTKYSRVGASSRYRTYQYLPFFELQGLQCQVSPLFDHDYLEHFYCNKSINRASVIKAFCRRLKAFFAASKFDLVVVEYELLPYCPAWLEHMLVRLGIPYIVDYDDAIFHQYDMHHNGLVRAVLADKIAVVMRKARLVTVGNEYLADYAKRCGATNVEIIPTVVDLKHYPLKLETPSDNDNFIIGWIGSPSTAKYLECVAHALSGFDSKHPTKLKLIGSGKVDLHNVNREIVEWSEDTEVPLLEACDVGIMPLPDEPWTRGKCGFKLIQYMACGLPVVASPVGVNKEIVEHGANGFLAETQGEWVQALELLRDDLDLRKRMGAAGRKKVEEKYSLQVTGPRYVKVLQSVIGSR